jgi:hypothetical protein
MKNGIRGQKGEATERFYPGQEGQTNILPHFEGSFQPVGRNQAGSYQGFVTGRRFGDTDVCARLDGSPGR